VGFKPYSLVNMKSYAFLFPGQGAQYVGMGKSVYESFAEARRAFDQADQILNFQISKLCFEGPEEELTKTVNAQVAIFVTSIAILRAIQAIRPDLKPAAVCGLSLGEFSALTACESLAFEDGVRLVKKRGELMQEAGEKNPGSMVSVIGLAQVECETVCQETGVQIANINSPEQIVLSGTVDGIVKAARLATQKGAKKAIILKVSGAFHSRLMQSAMDELSNYLKNIQLKDPKAVFIPNVTGEPVSRSEEIRSLLCRQVTGSVLWTKTVSCLKSKNLTDAFEIGPGKVLKGLIRRIEPVIQVTNLESKEDIEQTVKILEAV